MVVDVMNKFLSAVVFCSMKYHSEKVWVLKCRVHGQAEDKLNFPLSLANQRDLDCRLAFIGVFHLL